jgi:nucleotide-binding universal stress UspA family protein
MYKKILVAYDGSDNAKRALRAAIELGRAGGAELVSISVQESLPFFAATVGEVEEAREQIEEFFHRITKEAKDMAGLAGVELETEVRPGHEVETIVTYAKEGRFDLLVVGFAGHSNIFGRIMGSTAANLSRLAPCSVLIVK